MKYTTAIYILFAALVSLCAAQGTGCSADAVITARQGASWQSGDGKMNQIFDITVSNSGSCPLNNVGLNFDYPEGATITSQWNLLADNLYYLLQNFGPTLNQGQTATAGFSLSIDAASFASLSVAVHVYGAACPNSCGSSAPTSSAPVTPTSAPSSCATVSETLKTSRYTDSQGNTYTNANATLTNNGASSLSSITIAERPEAVIVNVNGLVAQPNNPGFYTLPASALPLAVGASYTFSYTFSDTNGNGFDVLSCSFASAPVTPSAAPSSAPSGPAPNCQGNAKALPRAAAPWTDAQGYTYQIYDIIANNTGSCPWTTISTYFAGNITQAWNYDAPSGLLSGYGSSIAAGAVFSGAGFIFVTAPTPVAGYPSSPVLARMVNRCGAPCSA